MFKPKASLIVNAGDRAYHFIFDNNSPFQEILDVLKYVGEGIEKLKAESEQKAAEAASMQAGVAILPGTDVPIVKSEAQE